MKEEEEEGVFEERKPAYHLDDGFVAIKVRFRDWSRTFCPVLFLRSFHVLVAADDNTTASLHDRSAAVVFCSHPPFLSNPVLLRSILAGFARCFRGSFWRSFFKSQNRASLPKKREVRLHLTAGLLAKKK